MVCLATTETVKSWIDKLKAQGCATKFNTRDGLASAMDGEIIVYMALQKGRGGPWIVKCYDSARITWSRSPISQENRP